MIIRDSSYIGGQWCRAGGSETFEVTDSATGEIIGRVTAATAADADAAVAAARAALVRRIGRFQ
jgi:acyl-CoA reductase-like NAD-dependent aldehyde dehydrogenase